MRSMPARSAALLAVVTLAACAPERGAPPPEPGDPLPGLTPAELARFEAGRAMFTKVWRTEDGLGPVYNENTCNACHSHPAPGGGGIETDEKVTVYTASGTCDLLADVGGGNVRQQVTPTAAAHGMTRERGPRGTRGYFTPPLLYGRGLMEAIPDQTLLDLADPDDRDGDGISGRVGRDAQGRVGRFTRKASTATLLDAAAGSLFVELGLTTPLQPEERAWVDGGAAPGADTVPDPEVGMDVATAIADFMRFLAPPAPDVPDDPAQRAQAAEGGRLFEQVGCARCHVPVLVTGPNEVAALDSKPVALYSDLLVHDMGPELADICGPGATPAELRTEVLMGLSRRSRFMHDGNSASLWDAIARHGGEGAASRAAFDALPELSRHALIRFLQTL
jgi:CxxC motif-containing protein (DUF1111 family)